MSFGARLAARRKELGLTQEDLGTGLGTNGADAGKQVVVGWEKGRHFPRVDQLQLICDRLGCSSDFLVLGMAASWPFSIEIGRFLALNPSDREQVEQRLEEAITLCELRLGQLADLSGQAFPDSGVRVTNASPARGSFIDLTAPIESKSGSTTRQARGLSKQGRGRDPK